MAEGRDGWVTKAVARLVEGIRKGWMAYGLTDEWIGYWMGGRCVHSCRDVRTRGWTSEGMFG